MTGLSFFVPGEPKGKGRPRFIRATGHAITPPAVASYERMVKEAAQRALGDAPVMLAGPLRMTVIGYWIPPKHEPGRLWHTPKPDADNLLKIICDALNGAAYADDAQIVDATVRKQCGAVYGVWVQLEEITS